ncbi:hypothetical protein O0I10_003216 [Lichtheimia ornata]|uniref:LIM zinc-binding domain-containing protein n=1 Tax=Lichtheimia ornata TaxID=688661 RepID=A0AAD7XXQ1_9FUNG|nr:uncharacterized protein O0I10_003216 [Lichtheimia ornata]KAJ8660994.1 hypothetical protein O0I10_003216 [Lichtheimia ornata]
MADLRISQVLPTVKCSDCNQPVHVRHLADHVCATAPPLPSFPPQPPPPQPMTTTSSPSPIKIDTSPATVRPTKNHHHTKSSVSPTSGSKFNFQFWTGKARDTLRSATQSRKGSHPRQQSPPPQPPSSIGSPGPAPYEHAITTGGYQGYHGKTSTAKTIQFQDRQWHSNDSDEFLVSPILDFTPPFAQSSFERKNSTSPAPPASILNQQRTTKPMASQSTSSDEMSPQTPRLGRHPLDALDYDLFNKRPTAAATTINHHHHHQCTRCRRDVANDGIRMGQEMYHVQCFSCFTCRSRLDPRLPPHEYQGRIYCETDYNMMVRRRIICAACEQPIGPHVRPTLALGQYYHPEHIRCFHCNKPINPEMTGIVERKGKLFCRPDFNKLYLPKCRGCGRAVEKEAVSSADGKLKGKWHKHCFRCHECQEPFPDNTFYIYNNAPYCRRDYHKMNRSLCKGCDEPVEGRCAQTVEGWRFHPQCFTCCICRCLITDVYYMTDNLIFCPQDKQFRSEKRHTFFQQL